MTPEEVKRIGDEEIFVFPPGDTRAFLTRRLDHRRFPVLTERSNLKPPEVCELPPIPKSEMDSRNNNIEAFSSWRSDPTLLPHRDYSQLSIEAKNPPPPAFGEWN